MATGQYLAEVSVALVQRGHKVTVLTSRRAYDDPGKLFPKTETWRGVRIIRIGSTGFGKGARWRRAADFASFLALCSLRLATLPRHDAIVALTSPPLISFLGAWLAKIRGNRFFYWVMDFNPDEAIAAGWLRPGSIVTRLLEAMSRFSLKRATRIIALDRFMRDRIVAKGISANKIVVLPPWSHDSEVRFDAEGRERFRTAHNLNGKFVVMYSGNHSPCHPLDTLLKAAEKLADDDPRIIFCFIGGGSEWRRIKEKVESRNQKAEMTGLAGASTRNADFQSPVSPISNRLSSDKEKIAADPHAPRPTIILDAPTIHTPRLSNLLCLPYQPLSQLSASLSAADLHVVVMGDQFIGLVHPCKIYNILAVAAPVLYIGPHPSHLSEIFDELVGDYSCAAAAHADVDEVVRQIKLACERGAKTPRLVPVHVLSNFSNKSVLPRLIGALEAA